MPNQSLFGRMITLIGFIIIGAFIFSLCSSIVMFAIRFFIPIAIIVGILYLINQNKRNPRY